LPMQPGDVYETQARVERLKDLTGYSPRVSIEDGIRRFVDWYLGEYLPLGLTDSTQFPLPLPVHTAFQDAAAAVSCEGWDTKDLTFQPHPTPKFRLAAT
jgi:hypothetical protein